MIKFIKDNILLWVVFITGACVLIIEITATRILSPFFGNTIFSVSSVLTVILAALSFGYYFGGILADKKPTTAIFYSIITWSGLIVLGSQLLSELSLPYLSKIFSIRSGPLVISMILFFAPAFLLGMLSPYAIKLQSLVQKKEGIGKISGKIFFVSTFGSILGSLLTGFVLIPNFGIKTIVLSVGIVLLVIGLLGRARLLHFVAGLALLYISLQVGSVEFANAVYVDDGVYQKVVVKDYNISQKTIRLLHLDKSQSAAVSLSSNELVFGYTQYYNLYKYLKADPKNILVVGGGGYVLPQRYIDEIPHAVVDVVEIEPQLYDVSKRYFGLKDSPRLNNYVEDGRRFLTDTTKKYDVIFLDAYSSITAIPDHMTTVEFFERVKSRLSSDGIVIANVIGDLFPEPGSLTFAEMKTFLSVFPNSYYFATESPDQLLAQNMIFLGINGDKKLDFTAPEQTYLEKQLIEIKPQNLDKQKLLTDNHAPVEILVANFINRLYENNPELR